MLTQEAENSSFQINSERFYSGRKIRRGFLHETAAQAVRCQVHPCHVHDLTLQVDEVPFAPSPPLSSQPTSISFWLGPRGTPRCAFVSLLLLFTHVAVLLSFLQDVKYFAFMRAEAAVVQDAGPRPAGQGHTLPKGTPILPQMYWKAVTSFATVYGLLLDTYATAHAFKALNQH